jgi:hypothetical protein
MAPASAWVGPVALLLTNAFPNIFGELATSP